MRTRVYKVQLLSAAFLHRADGAERAVLRATAFDAAARYWFRASCLGWKNHILHRLEGEFLGSTEHGQRVSLRVSPPYVGRERRDLLPQVRFDSASAALLPPLEARIAWRIEGLVHREEREAAVGAALALAIHLGGVGQRSRRGAGAWQLLEDGGLGHVLSGTDDVDQFAQALGRAVGVAVRRIRKQVRAVSGIAPDPLRDDTAPPYPAFSSCSRLVVAPLGTSDETEARRRIMERLRPFRHPVFGLPHRTRRRRVDGRHASPLHVSLGRLSDGGLVAIYTVLLSEPILSAAGAQPGSNAIYRFLDHERTNHGAVEVNAPALADTA
ncbi:MAG: hypothetical protein D6776_12025 [Planctomycetota bacterium]|nr:MAG: hypothetical protein D6776_12025 [Planctomycetota bacterium]